MAPVVPELMRHLRRRTRLAKRALRSATADEHKVFRRAHARAVRDGIAFDLTLAQFDVLVTRAAGHCEETGWPFSDQREPGVRIRPWRMSLDRIDNVQGYSFSNLRLVTAFTNISRNQLGLERMHIQRVIMLYRLGANIDRFVLSDEGPIDRWIF